MSESKPTTPPDLDAWRAEAGACAPLDAAATRGPWLTSEEAPSWDTPNAVGYDSREHHRGPPYYATGVRVETVEQAESDGRFIAAARTGWPRDAARVGVLCERVRALEAALSEALDLAAEATDTIEGGVSECKAARADIARLRALAAGGAPAPTRPDAEPCPGSRRW